MVGWRYDNSVDPQARKQPGASSSTASGKSDGNSNLMKGKPSGPAVTLGSTLKVSAKTGALMCSWDTDEDADKFADDFFKFYTMLEEEERLKKEKEAKKQAKKEAKAKKEMEKLVTTLRTTRLQAGRIEAVDYSEKRRPSKMVKDCKRKHPTL